MAPRLGFEPRTNGLTVHCSTAELPRNGGGILPADAAIVNEHMIPARLPVVVSGCLEGARRVVPLPCFEC